jgi:hypothetical protein
MISRPASELGLNLSSEICMVIDFRKKLKKNNKPVAARNPHLTSSLSETSNEHWKLHVKLGLKSL